MVIFCPVIYVLDGLQRYATNLAISYGYPSLFIGTFFSASSIPSSPKIEAVKSVFMKPGETELTNTL